MIFTPDDSPDGVPSGAIAPARSEPLESPPATVAMPLSSDEAARKNARGGRWAMTDYLDGWVLLGADGKPVMRNDGSRVGFFFHDAKRLAWELESGSGREEALPETAPEADRRAADWRKQRRALAPLDSGFNDDWDPQVQKSYLATVTKMVRLLAYDYVRTTEPEEAVRRAISDLLNNPVHVNGPSTGLWVPGKYDTEMVKSIADTLFSEAVGPEPNNAPSAEHADAAKDVSANDDVPADELTTLYEADDPNQDEHVVDDSVTDTGHPDAQQLTDPAMIDGDGQRVIDSRPQERADLGTDATTSDDPSKPSSPPGGGVLGDGSQILNRMLEPIAKLSFAFAEQSDTIASGKFAADKMLAPAMAVREFISAVLNDPVLGPAFEAYALFKGGVKTSTVNRPQHDKYRVAYWKSEAKTNPQQYTPANLERMKVGKAEIGSDGYPKELHHNDQGGLTVMTRTDHWLGENYKKIIPSEKKMTNDDDSKEDGFYDSSVRSQGDFGAVFECDDETGYFYFYAMQGEQSKIISAHHILNRPFDFEQDDISVSWNKTQSYVGLFIKGRLWAACEVETGVCFVGRYRAGDNSNIPKDVIDSFKLLN